ncbi:iron ABC transporter permease [Curtobacterium sp. MCBD17_028]|uniref:FecCD family ABC transporter permease n=1 Tax=Curtobacterium sp. MCBD17_028 TaxID=2175670 RepID=UPI000DAACB46|nr:iron chelate uptake ABC transporter family permease subunit [Curtobacterium sp. MCBD17_028]PZE30010.1 iron ABC transporter permease [Curtobacterium sp. MCBD17_028]
MSPTARPRRARLVGTTAVSLVVLAAACVLSVMVGARPIDPLTVVTVLLHPGRTDEITLIVVGERVPRTALGLVAGAALGVAGAVMQGVTRNPLADPGILGINAGAALAVVVGTTVFGIAGTAATLPFAFVGAAVAAVVVYGIASAGRRGPTPVGLALSGAVVAAALGSVTTAVLLTRQSALDRIRFWQVGSLATGDLHVVAVVAVPVVVGLAIAMTLGRSLDTLALGDELAASLGQRVVVARALGALATVLLAGAATAAIGPVGFVGLAVPHAVRRVTGPANRWTLPLSAIVAPALLLVADVIGRVVAFPGEVQVGIVTAVIGAPVFIALVRSRAVRDL